MKSKEVAVLFGIGATKKHIIVKGKVVKKR